MNNSDIKIINYENKYLNDILTKLLIINLSPNIS